MSAVDGLMMPATGADADLDGFGHIVRQRCFTEITEDDGLFVVGFK